MESVLQFDPASLSVWCVHLPPTEGALDVFGEIAQPALLGNHDRAIEKVLAIPAGRDRVRAGHVLSSVWHEQRHFIDVLLTNYGQSVMRMVTMVAINAGTLLDAARPSGKIGLPLNIYGDDVRRRIVGVDPVRELVAQARNIRDRDAMLRLDQHEVRDGWSIGGQAQLEVLGYITQTIAAQAEFGFELAAEIQADVPDPDSIKRRYRWAMFLNESLKLEARSPLGAEEIDGKALPTFLAPPIVAFLYGTLMIRRWGQPQTVVKGGDSGSAAGRMDPLFVELRRTGDLAAATSSAEAWQAVNDACATVFGRTAIEELREDLARESNFIGELAEVTETERQNVRHRYLTALYQARCALAEILESSPESVIDPTHYGEILQRVQPVPIFVKLAGTDEDFGDGWESLWGGSEELGAFGRQSWAWAVTPAQAIARSERINTATEPDAWTLFVRDLLPIAKLMLRGRREVPILGPELGHAEALMRSHDLELRFDPRFAAPTVDTASDAFWFLTGLTSAVCDSCDAALHRGAGRFVPAIAFRRNRALAEWLVDHYGGGTMGLYTARRNLSGWLLCNGCLEQLKALGAAVA